MSTEQRKAAKAAEAGRGTNVWSIAGAPEREAMRSLFIHVYKQRASGRKDGYACISGLADICERPHMATRITVFRKNAARYKLSFFDNSLCFATAAYRREK